jgi:PHP family Zn ribbon phosphoesterase
VRRFRADLHIHSCLSPCGDLDMSPKGIVEKSLERGMDIIAVCDHNSAENAAAVMRAGAQRGLHVFPGMEINSVEEVHTLAIFQREDQALAMQDLVYKHLMGTNRPELFGDQVVANEFDEVEGFNDKLLIGATRLGVQDVVNEVHRLGGLSIASHVDRPSFSILSQLGFVPLELRFDALEISPHLDRYAIESTIPAAKGFAIVSFSDAHFIEDIGRHYTTFAMELPHLDEMRMALARKGGREVEIH